MAARLRTKFLFLLAQTALLFQFSLAQGTTNSPTDAPTPAPVTSDNITDVLTTVGPVLTTSSGSVVTTGSAVVTQPPNPVVTTLTAVTDPAPGIGQGATPITPNTDLGRCFCDLTSNACDVNCCCDTDCSTEDLTSFTYCTDTAYVVNEELCFRSTIIYTENNPEVVNKTNSGFFCISIDNNEGRNYYNVPELIDSVGSFAQLVNSYGSTTYAKPDDPQPTYGNFYKAGDAIYTVYESLALGQLGLAREGYNSLCDDINPASFLYDQQTSCVRQLTNIQTDCETLPILSASTFVKGFKLVPTPSYLTSELNITVESDDIYANGSLIEVQVLDPVLCQDETGQQTNCGYDPGVVPAPSFNNTECNNVLLEVAFTITHNGSGWIELTEVQLVLGNIPPGTLHFGQKFSVDFVKASDEVTFIRSGNPGYVAGMPVLAGDLVSEVIDGETRFSIELSSDRNNWLTVIKSTADGTCETNPYSRTPVNFGEDLRTGCMVSVTFNKSSDRCSLIQEVALNAMNGVMREYVATFGNSDVEKVGDWVPIIVEEITGAPMSSVGGTCINMVMSLHIEIIYANAGSLANPQAKILGVRYNYAEGRTLKFTCSGAYCQTGTGSLIQNFEISTSVAFVDASTSPSGILAEDPGFEDKLPNDFFYPFAIGRSCVLQLDARLVYLGLIGYLFSYKSLLGSL